MQYLHDTSTPPGSISPATYNPVLVIQASLCTVDHMIHPSGTWSPTSDSNEATKFVLSIKVPKVQNQGTRTGNSKLSVFLHHSYNWISSFKFWGVKLKLLQSHGKSKIKQNIQDSPSHGTGLISYTQKHYSSMYILKKNEQRCAFLHRIQYTNVHDSTGTNVMWLRKTDVQNRVNMEIKK